MEFKILTVGDVVGSSGAHYFCKRLRELKRDHSIDFCIVDGENSAVVGIHPEQADRLFDAGADVITLGNHAFSQRTIVPMAEDCPYILRPANYSPLSPGRGWGVYDTKAGPLAVIVLQGRVGMDYTPDNPFLRVERILKEIDAKMILVEIPGGTGYVTDLGMTGPRHSVLGVKPEISIARFRGELTGRYEPAPGPCKLEGVIFTVDSGNGRCIATERVMIHD